MLIFCFTGDFCEVPCYHFQDGDPYDPSQEKANRVSFFTTTKIDKQVLLFDYVLAEDDTGTYSCEADNGRGFASGKVELAITGN